MKLEINLKNSRARELIDKFERSESRSLAQEPEDTLMNDLRARQKLLDPSKFSKEKVTVK